MLTRAVARVGTRTALLLPPALLLLLGALQLRRGQPLWYDELYTATVAPLPLRELARLVVDGAGPTAYLPEVPPSFNAPYYALVHAWLALPGVEPTPLALRLPSLLCAAAATGVLADVVRRLAGPRAGLLAGLLAASGPLLVEQSVEARSYGPALLATALAALGVVRRLQDGRGLVLTAVAGAAAGLLHWFALPALAGLAVGALRAGGRRGLGAAAVLAAAALPALGLVALSLSHGGEGGPSPAPVGAALPVLAVRDWAVGELPLAALLAAAAVLGAVRSRARALPLAWLLVPLAVVTAAELVRPVYYPRYLLPALLALAVLGALGVAALPPRLRVGGAALLVAVSLAADVPRLERRPRERPDEVVALLAARQAPGEPVVAVDARAALALDQYVAREAPRLRPDVVLPPQDVPAPGTSDVVWLVRFGDDGRLDRHDDDDLLEQGGYALAESQVFTAVTGDLTVQRWTR